MSAAPEDHDILYAANAPLMPGTERYYHLDGSRDDSGDIASLASNGRRQHLLSIPLGLADAETQHDIVVVSLLRRRIWLSGGRSEGLDEDFRFVVDGGGTWLVRLRSGDTPPDSAVGTPIREDKEEDQENGADEYTNLLDVPDVSPQAFDSSQFGASRLTRRQRRNQRRRVANTRLYDINTRISILRGVPHASTRLPGRFISSLDDIQNLADQLSRMPPHIISEETFGMFDRALDQLERTASLASLANRRSGTAVAAEDSQPEPDQPTHQLNPAAPAWTPPTQEQPTPSQSPPPTIPTSPYHSPPNLHLPHLRTIISSLSTMLSSPNPPTRQTFSPIRRAFDEISALLKESNDQPPDADVLYLVSTAQWLFWMLARRAFAGVQAVGVPVEARSVPVAMSTESSEEEDEEEEVRVRVKKDKF
jgi:hypothetical protein